MTRGINNWTYQDVVDVLKEHGFILNHSRGSHFYFVGKVGHIYRQVCVPYHGRAVIKPRTMRGIILQSGIFKADWLKS